MTNRNQMGSGTTEAAIDRISDQSQWKKALLVPGMAGIQG